MIENEFKLMLTKAQYEQVQAMYSFNSIVQTNHYYDTADLEMSARHITVRIRELAGKYYLQMKLPAGEAFSRTELSRELPGLPEALGGEALKELCGEECPDVSLLGGLKTTRGVYEFPGGEIDLDKSEYFGKTDYELEIEFTDEAAARAVLSNIKQRLGITGGADVCAGKIRRFLEEYRRAGKTPGA